MISSMFQVAHKWVQEHPARAGTLAGWYQQGCGALAALIVMPLVIRGLASESAGLWFCFQNMLAIINLTDFGLSFVVARQISYSLHVGTGLAQERSDFIPTRGGWQGVSDVYYASCALFRRVGLAALAILILLYHLVLPLGKLLIHADGETA